MANIFVSLLTDKNEKIPKKDLVFILKNSFLEFLEDQLVTLSRIPEAAYSQ